ncbi:helix-hairpin-helix domain-containing protein [Desulfopila sp. IMCC35008]|uniref:helix-hairpin-helix domain-containing protein n=1 Tax=Desulfopila sp. IMCC35008 TaxID=2653858 RepID=UPI0013D69FF4|nr:helix-hairpin-helix domain-containing protein [Desulfopila sp. IMCC35008]
MNPQKVVRNQVTTLTDLPNIGKKMEKDLQIIGIHHPLQLKGKSPYEMFDELCIKTGKKHDPCVIDVFISVTRFMDGEAPQPWWKYTRVRKEYLHNENV